jgi:hypothetical protein
MLRQFIWGAAVSVCNITIHALVMTVVVHVAQRTSAIAVANRSLLLGAAPAGSSMVYFAFVNYTTLGYGDITPLKEWQLLGPMTAMNGVLMFGWSTAVIFEVLRRTIASDGPAQVPH